ncbi:hypothetical protein DEFDS_P203 (plasmid) [Deferribacter desulfuricans SSM1]|uniref:Uncharacterized protein n=1 Tax=Deferribacter desulfuricans (strain DSM 14783 / JCM 11476 / NBRC 101012 / SSM1) TaxID=639282 RepID=D3PF31_DEFDS|nr:hypothetical protein [Deferribacter desulfuricans]BAI81823.1 hypothetical protein DEFDS_P203 [Deferribacter desulfuricans SSM1]
MSCGWWRDKTVKSYNVLIRLYPDRNNPDNYLVYTKVPLYNKETGGYDWKFLKTGTAEWVTNESGKKYMKFDNKARIAYNNGEKMVTWMYNMKGFVHIDESKPRLLALATYTKGKIRLNPDFTILTKVDTSNKENAININTKQGIQVRIPLYIGKIRVYSEQAKSYVLTNVAILQNKEGKYIPLIEGDNNVYTMPKDDIFALVQTVGDVTVTSVIPEKKFEKELDQQQSQVLDQPADETDELVEDSVDEDLGEEIQIQSDIDDSIDDDFQPLPF